MWRETENWPLLEDANRWLFCSNRNGITQAAVSYDWGKVTCFGGSLVLFFFLIYLSTRLLKQLISPCFTGMYTIRSTSTILDWCVSEILECEAVHYQIYCWNISGYAFFSHHSGFPSFPFLDWNSGYMHSSFICLSDVYITLNVNGFPALLEPLHHMVGALFKTVLNFFWKYVTTLLSYCDGITYPVSIFGCHHLECNFGNCFWWGLGMVKHVALINVFFRN